MHPGVCAYGAHRTLKDRTVRSSSASFSVLYKSDRELADIVYRLPRLTVAAAKCLRRTAYPLLVRVSLGKER